MRARTNRWSFMIIRGADKHVRQFSVSKRSMVAAPAIALLTVSSCFAGLQLRSAQMIGNLEQQLADQSAQLRGVIEHKDGDIRSLEDEIAVLNSHTEELRQKLQDLYELEQKLESFIDTYGDPSSSAARTTSSGGTSAQTGNAPGSAAVKPEALSLINRTGTPVPAADTAVDIIRMLGSNTPDFQEMTSMIEAMEESMLQTLSMAESRRAEMDATPNGWPTVSRKMTSSFGYRTDPFTGKAAFHAGIDISGRTGDAIFAAADGTIEETGFDKARGNYIVIKHRKSLKTVYMHLSKIEAKKGDKVVKGEKIGLLGSTGRSTGPHLHFEIMQNDEPINPLKYLRKPT